MKITKIVLDAHLCVVGAFRRLDESMLLRSNPGLKELITQVKYLCYFYAPYELLKQKRFHVLKNFQCLPHI